MILKTAADWWNGVAEIKDAIQEWGPTDAVLSTLRIDLLAYKELRAYMISKHEKTFWTVFDELLAARDPLLYWVLQSIWDDAPDSPIIHSWRRWGDFCDLCSEGRWILFEPGE